MTKHLVYLWMILIPAVTPGRTAQEPEESRIFVPDLRRFMQRLRGAENTKEGSDHDRAVADVPKTATKEAPPLPPDLPHLRQEVQRLKDTYHTEYLGWNSEDRSVFERIGEAARETPEMIDALIDLCEVKKMPSGITERYTPGTLTPSSSELTGLGTVVRPRVETALMKKNLTLWQRAVLEETLYSLALKEADGKGLPRPREYKHRILQLTDFENVPAQDAGTLLTNPPINSQPPFQPKLPSEITAPEPQPAVPPQAQPPLQTQPISHQPAPVAAPSAASRFRWGVAAAVLTVSVAWIGIKKRK